MKKLLALVLSLMMVFSFACALAKEPAVSYEGAWVKFEDGFELYLPADWLEVEVTDEIAAGGIFYIAASPDVSKMCQIGWSALEKDMSIEELQAAFATAYPDAFLANPSGVGLVGYTDAERNMLVAAALDGEEPGVYMFCFTPADDEAFQTVAGEIASTIRLF